MTALSCLSRYSEVQWTDCFFTLTRRYYVFDNIATFGRNAGRGTIAVVRIIVRNLPGFVLKS